MLGRTTRLKKTKSVNDTRLDPDFMPLNKNDILSMISVPILQHNRIRSIIEICSDKPFAFNGADVTIAEDVATELTRAWERASAQLSQFLSSPGLGVLSSHHPFSTGVRASARRAGAGISSASARSCGS